MSAEQSDSQGNSLKSQVENVIPSEGNKLNETTAIPPIFLSKLTPDTATVIQPPELGNEEIIKQKNEELLKQKAEFLYVKEKLMENVRKLKEALLLSTQNIRVIAFERNTLEEKNEKYETAIRILAKKSIVLEEKLNNNSKMLEDTLAQFQEFSHQTKIVVSGPAFPNGNNASTTTTISIEENDTKIMNLSIRNKLLKFEAFYLLHKLKCISEFLPENEMHKDIQAIYTVGLLDVVPMKIYLSLQYIRMDPKKKGDVDEFNEMRLVELVYSSHFVLTFCSFVFRLIKGSLGCQEEYLAIGGLWSNILEIESVIDTFLQYIRKNEINFDNLRSDMHKILSKLSEISSFIKQDTSNSEFEKTKLLDKISEDIDLLLAFLKAVSLPIQKSSQHISKLIQQFQILSKKYTNIVPQAEIAIQKLNSWKKTLQQILMKLEILFKKERVSLSTHHIFVLIQLMLSVAFFFENLGEKTLELQKYVSASLDVSSKSNDQIESILQDQARNYLSYSPFTIGFLPIPDRLLKEKEYQISHNNVSINSGIDVLLISAKFLFSDSEIKEIETNFVNSETFEISLEKFREYFFSEANDFCPKENANSETSNNNEIENNMRNEKIYSSSRNEKIDDPKKMRQPWELVRKKRAHLKRLEFCENAERKKEIEKAQKEIKEIQARFVQAKNDLIKEQEKQKETEQLEKALLQMAEKVKWAEQVHNRNEEMNRELIICKRTIEQLQNQLNSIMSSPNQQDDKKTDVIGPISLKRSTNTNAFVNSSFNFQRGSGIQDSFSTVVDNQTAKRSLLPLRQEKSQFEELKILNMQNSLWQELKNLRFQQKKLRKQENFAFLKQFDLQEDEKSFKVMEDPLVNMGNDLKMIKKFFN